MSTRPEHLRPVGSERYTRTKPDVAALTNQDILLLRHVADGVTLGQAATLMARAKSTVSERAQRLGRRGLLKRNGSLWFPTAAGLDAVRDTSGGGLGAIRTGARAHNFRLAANIIRAPPPATLRNRLPHGWVVGRAMGWSQARGSIASIDVDVPVHINTRQVVAYPPEQWGHPGSCALRALRLAQPVREQLNGLGVEITPFHFQTPPEFEYRHHEAAYQWLAERRPPGRVGKAGIWVDCSAGVPAVETDILAVSLAIERLPYVDGSFDAWAKGVWDLASGSDLIDAPAWGSYWRTGLGA